MPPPFTFVTRTPRVRRSSELDVRRLHPATDRLPDRLLDRLPDLPRFLDLDLDRDLRPDRDRDLEAISNVGTENTPISKQQAMFSP